MEDKVSQWTHPPFYCMPKLVVVYAMDCFEAVMASFGTAWERLFRIDFLG